MEEKELSTKERILVEAMKLFAVQGFDAVSVRAIAKEVGVRDSALYKHYESKQAIFDAIVEESKTRFLNKYQAMRDQYTGKLNLEEMCMNMFYFQTHDEWIVLFRQLLVIEQFKNPQMAAIYKALFVDMPIQNQAKLFQGFIDKGFLKDRDALVMSMELYAPFFLFHTCKEDIETIEERLKKHISYFKENYFLI